MISLLSSFFGILYIISKYQVLTYTDEVIVPKSLRIFGYIITAFFFPKGLFIKPQKSLGQRLVSCAEHLGPVYIKFGQSLSTRPDLVGQNITNHLKLLQDSLPAFDSNIAKDIIYSSFNKTISELFICFDDIPVAAASISQVHKAQLKSGEIVAIKILRPGIHLKYNKDIKLLYFLAKILSKVLKKYKRLKLLAVVDVFNQTMKCELDLRLEAAAASELRDNLFKDTEVYIPKIYWELTTEHIITTEWVDGVSIYNTTELITQGLNPAIIAQKFAITFLNQAYRDGYFHADLHPGNILVRSNGSIILLDFGIMGRLSDNDRLAIAENLFALLKKDYKRVAEIHYRAGYIPKSTNLDLFAQRCRAVAEPVTGLPIKNISIGMLLAQLFKITEEFGMEVQPQLLLLQKTIVMVEGVGQQLDPNINMWVLAESWIKKWATKNLSTEAKLLRAIKYLFNELIRKLET